MKLLALSLLLLSACGRASEEEIAALNAAVASPSPEPEKACIIGHLCPWTEDEL